MQGCQTRQILLCCTRYTRHPKQTAIIVLTTKDSVNKPGGFPPGHDLTNLYYHSHSFALSVHSAFVWRQSVSLLLSLHLPQQHDQPQQLLAYQGPEGKHTFVSTLTPSFVDFVCFPMKATDGGTTTEFRAKQPVLEAHWQQSKEPKQR